MLWLHLKYSNRNWSLRRKKKEIIREREILICKLYSGCTCVEIEHIAEISVFYFTLILFSY